MNNKNLLIQSYTHLWTILKNREEIYESNENLETFVYLVEKYMNGCRCNGLNELDLIENEYKIISTNKIIIDKLKSELNLDSLSFN